MVVKIRVPFWGTLNNPNFDNHPYELPVRVIFAKVSYYFGDRPEKGRQFRELPRRKLRILFGLLYLELPYTYNYLQPQIRTYNQVGYVP